MIDGVYDSQSAKKDQKAQQEKARIEEMSERDVSREIKRLEKQMLDHAKNLEFEKAAQVRDQLSLLKEQVFGASGQSHIVPITSSGKAA
jgi:excinuclease ABC subunit B